MDTKGLLIVTLVVALVAGGLLVAFKLSNPSDRPGARGETTTREDEDYPQDTVDSSDGPVDATDPTPPPEQPDRSPVDRPSRAAPGSVLADKPAPGSGAESSGPRDERLEHLRSTVTAEQVAAAVRTLETSTNPQEQEQAIVVLVRDRDKANKEFFIATLRDESQDARVRAQAATGLGRIGAMEALPYLLAAMADEAEIVRARANAAFVRLSGRNYQFKADAPREEREMVLDNIRGSVPAAWLTAH